MEQKMTPDDPNTKKIDLESSENMQQLRELHGIRLLGYTISTLGIYLPSILISVFVFQFYVYTINLDPLFTSVGITGRALVSGVTSILIGVILDKKKSSKIGKRRPFLLYFLPLWVLSNILLWMPPWKCPENSSRYWPTTVFFWTVCLCEAISKGVILGAILSMLPEQSQTTANRKKIAEINTLFGITSAIFSLALPLVIQSLVPDPSRVKHWEPSGVLISSYILLIGVIFTVLGICSILATFFSVDESFQMRLQHEDSQPLRLGQILRNITLGFRDRNYAKLLGMVFFTGFAQNMVGALVIAFMTYSLSFTGSDFYLYILLSIFFKIFYVIATKAIGQKISMLKTILIIRVTLVLGPFLMFFFLFELPWWLTIVLFIISFAPIWGGYFAMELFMQPISSRIIDDAARKNAELNADADFDQSLSAISGSYSGANILMANFGPALGSFILGSILSGADATNPTVLTLTMLFTAVPFFISLLFNFKLYNETRNTTPQKKENNIIKDY